MAEQPPGSKILPHDPGAPKSGYLSGRVLIAMPQMADERFAGSLIYLCAHSEDGAMGIVVNRILHDLDFAELLRQLEIDIPEDRLPATDKIRIHRGGPVETGRGFVLHTSDYAAEKATLEISDGISLTATLDILRAIAVGSGPEKMLLALGYAGWAPGQLEGEIQANGWLICDSDSAILFDNEVDERYGHALGKLGIDPGMLSMEGGHA